MKRVMLLLWGERGGCYYCGETERGVAAAVGSRRRWVAVMVNAPDHGELRYSGEVPSRSKNGGGEGVVDWASDEHGQWWTMINEEKKRSYILLGCINWEGVWFY